MLFKCTSQETLFVSFDKLTQKVTWKPRRPNPAKPYLKGRHNEGHINKDAHSGPKWNQTPCLKGRCNEGLTPY